MIIKQFKMIQLDYEPYYHADSSIKSCSQASTLMHLLMTALRKQYRYTIGIVSEGIK